MAQFSCERNCRGCVYRNICVIDSAVRKGFTDVYASFDGGNYQLHGSYVTPANGNRLKYIEDWLIITIGETYIFHAIAPGTFEIKWTIRPDPTIYNIQFDEKSDVLMLIAPPESDLGRNPTRQTEYMYIIDCVNIGNAVVGVVFYSVSLKIIKVRLSNNGIPVGSVRPSRVYFLDAKKGLMAWDLTMPCITVSFDIVEALPLSSSHGTFENYMEMSVKVYYDKYIVVRGFRGALEILDGDDYCAVWTSIVIDTILLSEDGEHVYIVPVNERRILYDGEIDVYDDIEASIPKGQGSLKDCIWKITEPSPGYITTLSQTNATLNYVKIQHPPPVPQPPDRRKRGNKPIALPACMGDK